MNIGYVYEFDSYSPTHGGGVHVHNLVKSLTASGCKIHAFDDEHNPACEVYPKNILGIRSFLHKVDLVYVRIDGSLLSESDLKLQCMNDEFSSKPIVWEINAPADEFRFRYRLKNISHSNQRSIELRRIVSQMRRNFALWRIVCSEDKLRRRHARRVKAAVCVSHALQDYARKGLRIRNSRTIPNGS